MVPKVYALSRSYLDYLVYIYFKKSLFMHKLCSGPWGLKIFTTQRLLRVNTDLLVILYYISYSRVILVTNKTRKKKSISMI